MSLGRPREEASAGAAGAMALLPSGARWLPSHVQVTVQRARALRPKGGPDGAFVALELGRQRLRTAVAPQRDGGPRWGEDCALELELPPSDRPDDQELLLRVTVWQRALVGPDRFLGRASVPLAALLDGGRAHHDQWYKLHSKPGKKEKERGEIQLSIQFTRHSLTASMFDLSIKDKPRSPFGRLKDKVKGRKYDLESASAIVPSSSGGLDDSDFELAGKKAKARGVGGFFKSRLRRSSLTQSNTSLGSDSTVSSAGSLVGLGTAETMAPSPSRHSILSTDHSVGDVLSSPKLTHKRAFSDGAPQALPESKSVPPNEPRSSLCINGSHVYCEEPSPKPAPQSPALPPAPPQSKPRESPVSAVPHAPEPELPPWSSSHFQKGPPKDPPRFIPSPPILAAQEEDKLSVKTIALNKHRGRVRREEGLHADSRPVQIATPLVFSSEVMRVRPRTEEEAAAAKAGVLSRGSGKDGDGRRLVGESLSGPTKDVVTAGGDKEDQSNRWNLQDAKESLPRPSPHVVRPISTPVPETAGAEEASKHQQPSLNTSQSPVLSGQQRPEPSSVDSTAPALQLANTEPKRDTAGLDPSAKYYHLTHEELIQLVLKREAELGKKQEHVQELENYIDRLLVRIMEQSPTLLQIPLGREPKIAK